MAMSAPAYRRYERNEVQPTIDRMSQLADIYEISLDALCRGGGGEEAVPGGPGKVHFDVQQGERFSIVISINGHVGVSNKKVRPIEPDF
jgi:transcriptional regulator with XRE-family HTH domain